MNFLFDDQPDARPVTIRTTRRDMLVRTLDGDMQHTPTGSTITVERHTLATLAPDDFEIVDGVHPPAMDHSAL